MASKRRSFISLIFIINCITKCSLIRILIIVLFKNNHKSKVCIFSFSFVAPSGSPRDVVIIPHGKNTIRVSWSIPSAEHINGKIIKYEVILYKPNGEIDTFVSEDKLSKDIKGLETNQKYYIGVRAYTMVGPGPYSNNVTYLTGTKGSPSSLNPFTPRSD